jgi:uroporphyrinogen III methyltransferase/synthase
MEDHRSKDLRLAGRTILIAPSAPRELVLELERHGARAITWPEIEIADPESFTALDEAIENLFGYDWLLFRTQTAAEFFLKRFQKLGHEISELDTLRVCAMDEATVAKLEASQIHLDLIPDSPTSNAVFAAIESYAGGREALGRLNFLIPRSAAARDGLCDLLEDAGARVDVVIAYRAAARDTSGIAQLNAFLTGGGIDSIAFTSPSSVRDLRELLDTIELDTILDGMTVFCIDNGTTKAAKVFGLRPLLSPEPTVRAMVEAMADHPHDD